MTIYGLTRHLQDLRVSSASTACSTARSPFSAFDSRDCVIHCGPHLGVSILRQTAEAGEGHCRGGPHPAECSGTSHPERSVAIIESLCQDRNRRAAFLP